MSSEAAAVRPDAEVEFQYHDAAYQADTALSGMWLFLASEVPFFGGLFLTWCVYRYQHPAGFAEATRDTQFAIGTINTVILLTSSFSYACAVAFARLGDNRRILAASVATALLGALFLGLKVFEWYLDISDGDVPGAGFKFKGAHDGGAELFWVFYYIGTGLHGVHLAIGIALVGWIAWQAHRRRFSRRYTTPVEVVGLYWSFVDMVWMILYPLIYLAGRAGG